MAVKANKRRNPLNRERVLEAAVQLADEGGLATLSMRKLASSLGVEAMSLYNHVANKDDLLDGMVDRVMGEVAVPSLTGDWRDEMRRRATSAYEMLMRHPWAAMVILTRVNVGPNMLRYVDATIGCLRGAGFSLPEVDRAWNAVDNHIYGFALQRLNFPFEEGEYAAAAREYLPTIPREQLPHLHAMTLEVAEGRHVGVQDFSYGLEMILDGLARRLSTTG